MREKNEREQQTALKNRLTNPYPRLFPVCLSVMTTASSMSPNCLKYSRRLWSVVWYGRPPTKSFVYVVSFCCTIVIATCASRLDCSDHFAYQATIHNRYSLIFSSFATEIVPLYTGWQWRNFFILIYASCSGRHDVGQGNLNILQHLQSDRRSGASTSNKLFSSRPIQFYLNNVTNLHQLTSQSTNKIVSWPWITVTSLHPVVQTEQSFGCVCVSER